MSWAETYKINSNFSEPLNLLIYLNDISTREDESYVLAEQNRDLWQQLITQSVSLFGNRTLHDVVYERFTDADVDYMLRRNGKIGSCLNRFYQTNRFTDGPVDALLREMTTEQYHTLDVKFADGINRYISENTVGENAGPWLANLFDVPEFARKTDVSSILTDKKLWDSVIFPNEPVRLVICNSAMARYYASAGEISPDIYHAFLQNVAQYTTPMMDLLEQLRGHQKLNEFFHDETCCQIVANSPDSMTAIIYSIDAFAAMCASPTAMSAVAQSQTAVDILLQGFVSVSNILEVLQNIRDQLEIIKNDLPQIDSSEYAVSEVRDTQNAISHCIQTIESVLSNADIIVANVTGFVNSDVAMNAVVSNSSAFSSVLESAPAMAAVAASSVAMNAILSSESAMQAAVASSTAMSAILQNTNALDILAKSQNSVRIILSSILAMNFILNSSTAMDHSGFLWALNSCNPKKNSYPDIQVPSSASRSYNSSSSSSHATDSIPKGAYTFNGSGEWASYDKIEIGRNTPVYASNDSASGLNAGYVKSDDRESVVIGNTDQIVFCTGRETVVKHADSSNSATTSIYRISSFG